MSLSLRCASILQFEIDTCRWPGVRIEAEPVAQQMEHLRRNVEAIESAMNMG